MTATVEVRVPDVGDFKNIPVIEILVKPGDRVAVEQSIVTLESDKATLDVPAPTAGRVASLAVSQGTRVSQGSLILTLDIDDVGVPTLPAPVRAAVAPMAITPQGMLSEPTLDAPVDHASPSSVARIYASPSVRRFGRELGADLSRMTGSGPRGRILADDVQRSVREELQTLTRPEARDVDRPSPKINFSKYGAIERQPLSRIRRISGPALARNWASIPHVTNFDEADVTELDTFRIALNQELSGNPKVTLLSFLVKAAATTLMAMPTFNASLDGEELILKKYVHVGVAVDTPGGLVVPVIRDADRRGILDIARELSEKATAARAGKLKSSDFEGGSFTVSSLGGVGGTGFTPIINAPEIAILGAARAAMRPLYDGKQFQPRLMLPLALSWDHRATDGVAAARFLAHLVALLQDFRRVSL